ncbi:hypothetical protein NX059_006205 [Plenodomus lindquistii]|nr:hypothetical protein NX059_006205 [Plenodomus lindquistii]
MNVQPTSFMFIDASNGGINAKPDKVVRSFVMKSARNKKTWSTKPRSPVFERPVMESSSKWPSPRPGNSTKSTQNSDQSSPSECDTSPASRDQSVVPSPSITSAVSSQNSDWAYESPVSMYASPRAEFNGAGGFVNDITPSSGSRDYYNPQVIFQPSLQCLAVPLDTYSEGLIHEFVKFTIPNLLPIDVHGSSKAATTHWIATCLQSPIGAPFIYAALTTSTRAVQLDSDVYKWRAVSEVNKLLTNHGYSTDDTTIASVLILLALEEADLADPRMTEEARLSSINAHRAHLSGLQTMIAQRGGLLALGGNRCLQVCILMHSIAQAITSFRRPYALLLDSRGYIEDYRTVSSTLHTFTMSQHCRNLGVSLALLEIIHALSTFVADLIIWYETGSSLVDSLELQKHASLLTYRLFDWYDRCPKNGPAALGQSVCLALLIFMTHATEPISAPVASRLAKAVAKLHSSLSQISPSQWSNAPDLYLWTITMGALGAHDLFGPRQSPSRDSRMMFFVEHFGFAFGTTNFTATAAAHVLGKLHSCLWIPSVLDGRLTNLWSSLESYRSSISTAKSVPASVGHDHCDNNEYALGQSTTRRFFSKKMDWREPAHT